MASEIVLECPLHIAVGELAQVAVRQHILHLEGECLPRPELVAELDRWSGLHTLIRNCICPTYRHRVLAPGELSGTAQDLMGSDLQPGPGALPTRLQATLAACAVCSVARSCPLGGGGEL